MVSSLVNLLLGHARGPIEQLLAPHVGPQCRIKWGIIVIFFLCSICDGLNNLWFGLKGSHDDDDDDDDDDEPK